MTLKTTPDQRRKFYDRHRNGEGYQEIADLYGLSKECVRYWCRRQRDGGSCETAYQRRRATGLQQRIEPRVRYVILRLRLENPRWGPNRILAGLKRRPFLRELHLPSEATIGRYLHQWPCFSPRRISGFHRAPEARPADSGSPALASGLQVGHPLARWDTGQPTHGARSGRRGCDRCTGYTCGSRGGQTVPRNLERVTGNPAQGFLYLAYVARSTANRQ